MKRLTILFIAIIMIISGSAIMVHGEDINTNTYNITITTNDNALSVTENLKIDATTSDTITFWLQSEATDIAILIDGNSIDHETTGSNTYTCNISDLEVTTDTTIQVNYTLIKDTPEFKKKLQYNTSEISITLDELNIYSGTSLSKDCYFDIALQKPIEQVTKTEETIVYQVPDWYYLIIIALIILVLLSFVFPSKKQKTTKKKEATTGSEELLGTKKTLLMELLKDIEKQHRAKQISDDTYHKLKEQYKQEAVDAMKKLEDMKSKVK